MEIESLTFKNEKEYKEFLDYLFSIRDIKYRDFNAKIIVPVDSEIIGIRTPILRDIGKKIAKISAENFLNLFEKLFIKTFKSIEIQVSRVWKRFDERICES